MNPVHYLSRVIDCLSKALFFLPRFQRKDAAGIPRDADKIFPTQRAVRRPGRKDEVLYQGMYTAVDWF